MGWGGIFMIELYGWSVFGERKAAFTRQAPKMIAEAETRTCNSNAQPCAALHYYFAQLYHETNHTLHYFQPQHLLQISPSPLS